MDSQIGKSLWFAAILAVFGPAALLSAEVYADEAQNDSCSEDSSMRLIELDGKAIAAASFAAESTAKAALLQTLIDAHGFSEIKSLNWDAFEEVLLEHLAEERLCVILKHAAELQTALGEEDFSVWFAIFQDAEAAFTPTEDCATEGSSIEPRLIYESDLP